MAFSKQHYIKVAEIIKKLPNKQGELLTDELIQMFKEDNPRFNEDIFLKACGYYGNKNEDVSPSGGKTSFKNSVNEAFENLGMKLMPLIPVGKLSSRAKLNEDLVGDIMTYEEGRLSDSKTLQLFSNLIKSGKINHLQGSYGRTAHALIQNGLLDDRGNITSKGKNLSGNIPFFEGKMKLMPLLESSAPIASASYVDDYDTQSRTCSLWMFRVGDFKVFVATTPDGEVSHNGSLPWFWASEKEAAKQIANWR